MNHGKRNSKRRLLTVCLSMILAVSLGIPDLHGNRVSAAESLEAAASARAASGTVYYVSADGDDANDGKSESQSWRTLEKVNNMSYAPGDRILFKAGDVWNGSLKLRGISGTADAPIVFSSYGNIKGLGRPVINGNGTTTTERSVIIENYKGVTDKTMSATIDVVDGSYLEFSNFELTNYHPDIISQRAGINIRTASTTVSEWEANPRMGIVVKNNYIHDVNGNPKGWKIGSGGILILGNITDVLVEGNIVKRVDIEGIRNAGLYKEGDIKANFPRVFKDIIFRNNYVEEVQGDGFVMSNVGENGRMEYNTVVKHSAKDVGNVNYAGLWVIAVKDMVMQYNEVYGGVYGYNDGQAFDVDMFSEGALYQYNYSHSNRGGFMLFMDGSTNSVARYNISVNDGDGRYLLHYLPTQAQYAPLIHNNTFFTDENISTKIFNTSGKYARLYNNIFYSKADTPMGATSFSGGEIKNNIFYPGTGIKGTAFPGAVVEDNIFESPKLARPGEEPKDIIQADASLFDAEKLNGYKLLSDSPAINAGLDVSVHTPSVWGKADKDFYDNPLTDGKADIGAHEYSGDAPANRVPEVLPMAMKLNQDKLDLYAQQAGQTLAVEFTPKDAWFKGIKWSSSNPRVAAVDAKGFITPLSPGKASIRAESTFNTAIYAETQVTVHPPSMLKSYQVGADQAEISESHPSVQLRVDGVTEEGITLKHAPYYKVQFRTDQDRVTVDQETGILTANGDVSGMDAIEVTADVEEYSDIQYSQSFEAGWGDFVSETGTPIETGVISDQVAYQGERSALFVKGNGSNAIQKLFGSPQQGIVTMMLYDDGSKSGNTRVVAHVGNARSQLLAGMGVLYDGNPNYGSQDYYSVRASGVSTAWEKTSIKRSKGWHELKWDYTSGTELNMYIDGHLVKTTNVITHFDRIVLGFLWDSANGRTFAFDNIKYASTDDKVTKPAEKLTLSVHQTVDRAALNQAITVAQSVYDPAVEGTEPGQYPAGSKLQLFDAIEAAKAVLNQANALQDEIDAAVTVLQAAVAAFQSLVIVDPGAPVDKSRLNEAITVAKSVYAEAVEGVEPGQYPPEAMLRFHHAIQAAEDVMMNEDVTQADVQAAISAIDGALAEFKGSMIPGSKVPSWLGGILTAENVSATSIHLHWSGEVQADQVEGYTISRNGVELANVTGSVYRYHVTGLSPDSIYSFKVEAGSKDKWSHDGPSITVRTAALVTEPGGGSSDGGTSSITPSPTVPKTGNSEEESKEAEEDDKGEVEKPSPPKLEVHLQDIDKHWASKAIEKAVELGWVQGYKDHTFRPNAKITRAEFAVLLGRALGLGQGQQGTISFEDADGIPAWAKAFVTGVVKAGIMNGYEDQTFRPAQELTRLEMTVMIARAKKLPLDPQAKISFADADQIPAWAQPYVAAAVEAKLIQGRGQGVFAPQAHATRAESVSLIVAILGE
ncbi:S-layer homology domain-containing protein [Paenibacillus lautus]|uniref:S-layer homology domain-containing protein n=1 Tax=Paenibacillus lautus TaxID=1401 RepID=UPI003D2DF3CD